MSALKSELKDVVLVNGHNPPPSFDPGQNPVDPILQGHMPPGAEHLRSEVERLVAQGVPLPELNGALLRLRHSGQLNPRYLRGVLAEQSGQLEAMAGGWTGGCSWYAYSDTEWCALAFNEHTQTYGWSLSCANRAAAELQAVLEAGPGSKVLATGKERTFAIGRLQGQSRWFWASAGPFANMAHELNQAYVRQTGQPAPPRYNWHVMSVGGQDRMQWYRTTEDGKHVRGGSYCVTPEAVAQRQAESEARTAAVLAESERQRNLPPDYSAYHLRRDYDPRVWRNIIRTLVFGLTAIFSIIVAAMVADGLRFTSDTIIVVFFWVCLCAGSYGLIVQKPPG